MNQQWPTVLASHPACAPQVSQFTRISEVHPMHLDPDCWTNLYQESGVPITIPHAYKPNKMGYWIISWNVTQTGIHAACFCVNLSPWEQSE